MRWGTAIQWQRIVKLHSTGLKVTYLLDPYVLLKSDFKYAGHTFTAGKVRLRHVNTADNIADLLTKPLQVRTFKHLQRMMLKQGFVKVIAIKGGDIRWMG